MKREISEKGSLRGTLLRLLKRACVSEILAKPVELHIKNCDESLGFSTGSNQDLALSSFEVRKAMLQAERRKAEALNMLRLKETM